MLKTTNLNALLACLLLLLSPLARGGDTLIWVDHGDGHIDNDNHGLFALRDFPDDLHHDDPLDYAPHEWHHGDYDRFAPHHHDHDFERERDLLGEHHLDWLAHDGHDHHEHDRHHDRPFLSDEDLKEFREFQAHRHHDW